MARPAGWTHPYRPTTPYIHPKTGCPRVVIYVDEDTYSEIDAAAKANNCSFSSQARLFIDVGIETLEIEGRDNG